MVDEELSEVQLEERKKLVEEIDNLCQKLYGQVIDEVYPNYSDLSEEILKVELSGLKTRLEILEKAKKEVKGRYILKDLWRKFYDSVIIEQPLYRELYFYTLVGQIFFWDFKIVAKHKDEDLRIHPVLIGPTGTGKTESSNLIADVIVCIPRRKYINAESFECIDCFKVRFPKKLTDAALIGSYDSAIFQTQRVKKIKEGDERFINPIIFGTFQENDLVIFDEAEIIFKPGRFSEQVQTHLRTVMNRYGTPGNALSNDSLRAKDFVYYNPSCSIIMTSYYLVEFETTFMEGGLMQRTALVIEEEDPEKRSKIQDEQISSVEDDNEEKFRKRLEEFKELKLQFIDKLTGLKLKTLTYREDWKPEYRKKVSFPEDVREKIRLYKEEIRSVIPLTIVQKEKFDSMLGRMVLVFFKFCALNAIIDGRIKVNVEDVDESFLLIRELAISSAEFIKTHTISPKQEEAYSKMERDVIMVLSKKELPKVEFNKLMGKIWGVSEPTAINRLKKFRDAGIFDERLSGIGNQKICKLRSGIGLW